MLVRATVALASIATAITAPILLLALRSAALLAVFFRISLVSVHLRNFCFSSWDSLWPVQMTFFANSACLLTSLSVSSSV